MASKALTRNAVQVASASAFAGKRPTEHVKRTQELWWRQNSKRARGPARKVQAFVIIFLKRISVCVHEVLTAACKCPHVHVRARTLTLTRTYTHTQADTHEGMRWNQIHFWFVQLQALYKSTE